MTESSWILSPAEPLAVFVVIADATGPHATAAGSPSLSTWWRGGAELSWIGYDDLTPLDAARRSGADALVTWLSSSGTRTADETRRT